MNKKIQTPILLDCFQINLAKRKKMRIDMAYCQELDKIIDIYDAHFEYFRQEEPRKDFNFLCSDKECREQNHTRVTGVNYRKKPEDGNMFRVPHFRELDEHIRTCEWVEIEEALSVSRLSNEDKEKEKIRRSLLTKDTDLINIFTPGDKESISSQSDKNIAEILHEIKAIDNKEDRLKQYNRVYSQRMSKTSKLHKVVSCYLALRDLDALQDVSLEINHQTMTYYAAFRHVQHYRDELKGRIFYGGAKVTAYPSGYAVKFYDESAVDWPYKGNTISLFITKKELNGYRHKKYLTELLDEASQPKPYVNCFFYGHLEPSPTKAGALNVVVTSLDHIYLLLRLPKAGTAS